MTGCDDGDDVDDDYDDDNNELNGMVSCSIIALSMVNLIGLEGRGGQTNKKTRKQTNIAIYRLNHPSNAGFSEKTFFSIWSLVCC